MKNSLIEFEKQIKSINTHLKIIEQYNKILKNYRNNDVDFIINNITEERVFTYRSNIISLYGAFEHFLESVIREYIQSVHIYLESFNDWGEKVTNNYIDLWKKLHGKLSYPKFNTITSNSMVENLYDVILNNKSKLMPECYLQNGGNYKSTIISNMFNDIGIDDINANLYKYDPLKTYLLDKYPSSQKLDVSKKKELYFQKLDDLVERRNEIAHGSTSTDLIDNDMFADMLLYISCYAKSLNSFLTDKIYEKQWKSNNNTTIKIDKVFHHNGNVALLHIESTNVNHMVSVGDKLLVNYKDGGCSRFFITEIKEIRVDLKSGEKGKIVEKIFVDNNVEQIAIEVLNEVKTNQKIKLITSK